MANLRTNNLSGEQGQNAYRGSVYFRGYIDGTAADFLSVPESDDLDMGTGDFTLECWVRAAESSGEYAGILGMHEYSTNGFVFQIGHTGKLRLVNPNYMGHDDSTVTGSTVIIPQDGTFGDWHHLAVVRSSGTIKGYVNGVEEVSFSHSSGVDFANGGSAVIGATSGSTHPGDYDLKGYLSNLRLIKGTALYTTNYFTPPTSELTVVDGTVLLCCQDSDDPTQEATGKTITANGFTDLTNRTDNLIKNGRFTVSATENWTLSGGTAALSTGQSSAFGDGNHVALTATSSYAYLKQSFTTVIGRTYRTDGQSNGGDASFISTSTSENDAVVTDIRGGKTFVAAQTTHHVILRGNTGGANFDTISVHEDENSVQPKVIPPYGVDAGNAFGGPIQQSSEGYMYFPTGRTEERGRGRGLIIGNLLSGTVYNTVQFVNIQSMGNAIDFGDTSTVIRNNGALASSTRALSAGGANPSTTATIDFFTIATASNATDFGDMTTGKSSPHPTGNQTRGVWAGAYNYPAGVYTIDFVNIASQGNAGDFGDRLNSIHSSNRSQINSTTRGLITGGYVPSPGAMVNIIEKLEIATTGNTTDFGDLTSPRNNHGATSSNTRGIIWGGSGQSPTPNVNIIDFVTIASAGDATDFGDLIGNSSSFANSCMSNNIRGLSAGGDTQPGNYYTNIIQHITIATTGDAQDFGDMLRAGAYFSSTSDSHGGL